MEAIIEKKYECPYCHNKFKRMVQPFLTQQLGRNKISSQVQCRKCGNFLPTFTKEERGK